MSYLSLSRYQREQIDFVNMAAYHLSILIWYYYVLTTAKASSAAMLTTTSSSIVGQDNLDVWNRALERLLQR
jgi:hypothetical protein